MELGLEGKRVFVTGSTRGIGRGIAERFLEEGARVALNGRTASSVERAATELRERYGEDAVSAVAADLAGTDSEIAAAVVSATSALGGLDIVIANVGSGRGVSWAETDESEWLRMLRINLVGSATVLRHAVPQLRQAGGGSIVLIGSIAGHVALPAPVPYSAAKAALRAVAVNLAQSLAVDGIRVNLVSPGNVLYPDGTWQKRLTADPATTRKYIEDNVPLKRFGTPADISTAVVFLASDRSAGFITGATLVVDGGQLKGF
jgi:3-oxoacyl-[acyl-carrier protein] reductase